MDVGGSDVVADAQPGADPVWSEQETIVREARSHALRLAVKHYELFQVDLSTIFATAEALTDYILNGAGGPLVQHCLREEEQGNTLKLVTNETAS